MIGQAVRVHHLVESERKRLLDENTKLRRELTERYDIRNLVGSSRAMQSVYEQVAQVAALEPRPCSSAASRAPARSSWPTPSTTPRPRAKKPFVKVSCAALPESLVESELFGYEPGAFTDARAQKKGRFELAHGGTIFLDEIGGADPLDAGEAAAGAPGAGVREARRRRSRSRSTCG